MLAKKHQAHRSYRQNASSLTFFASKLAPTRSYDKPYPYPTGVNCLPSSPLTESRTILVS
ncbi:hypothetical protein EMIT0P218_60028 [Pseudomonas sp. IT-P218]